MGRADTLRALVKLAEYSLVFTTGKKAALLSTITMYVVAT